MSRLKETTTQILGGPTASSAGLVRTLRGMRTGDPRELGFGLALLAFAYLRRTAPRRQLIYSQVVKPGTHITVRNTPSGAAQLQISERSENTDA